MSRRKTIEISHSEVQGSNEGVYGLMFYLVYGVDSDAVSSIALNDGRIMNAGNELERMWKKAFVV
jgi:hypothetical protein